MATKTDLFYIVTQPGFEDELIDEISEFWGLLVLNDSSRNINSLEVISKEVGGVLIQCDLILGLQINYFSRLASRVLLRVFEKKFEKMSQLPQWISSYQLQEKFNSQKFNFKIQAHSSFHWNEKRYLKHLEEKGLISRNEEDPTLYVRVQNNILTLSIDTSGDHLHKRGYRFFDNQASLRETIASFCLRKLTQNYGLARLSELTVLDPMCGSGTFLFEAHDLFKPNFSRNFSFLNFSITPKLLKSSTFEKNFRLPNFIFKDYLGFDIDSASIDAAVNNLKSFESKTKVETKTEVEQGSLAVFKFQDLDFFSLKLSSESSSKALLILNPPYGFRKEKKFSASQLIGKISELKVLGNAVLWPKSESKDIEIALEKKDYKYKFYPFKNGGIDVQLYVFSN
jgi:putative N6-adenine-specific DNA methylase